MSQMHLIPTGLLAAVQQYLMTQPMGEVEGLMNALRACQPAAQKVEHQEVLGNDRPSDPS